MNRKVDFARRVRRALDAGLRRMDRKIVARLTRARLDAVQRLSVGHTVPPRGADPVHSKNGG